MGNPGPEGSVGKLASAELNIRIWNCCMDILGDEGMLHEPGYPMNATRTAMTGPTRSGSCERRPTRSRAVPATSCATSSASECSVLPGEPRVDKAIPWTEIPT